MHCLKNMLENMPYLRCGRCCQCLQEIQIPRHGLTDSAMQKHGLPAIQQRVLPLQVLREEVKVEGEGAIVSLGEAGLVVVVVSN